MNAHQQSVYGILLQFERVCRDNGLRYYLCGGTLLGAVRHKGFIPWDDDIDVMMPIEDYRKFVAIAPKALPDGFVLQAEETEAQFPFLFAKVCDTTIPFDNGMAYRPSGIFIDVFPVSYCKAPTKLRRICFDANLLITQILMGKCGWIIPYRYSNPAARLLAAVLSALSPALLKTMRRALLRPVCTDKPTDHVCSIAGIYKSGVEMFPAEWLAESAAVPFEDSIQPAPVMWDAYLTHFYGDYMTPPPVEQRTNHLN